MTLWYTVDHGTETKRIDFDFARVGIAETARGIAKGLKPGKHKITFWDDEDRKSYLSEHDVWTFVDAVTVIEWIGDGRFTVGCEDDGNTA